jgi:hypothetical protein
MPSPFVCLRVATEDDYDALVECSFFFIPMLDLPNAAGNYDEPQPDVADGMVQLHSWS